ncbi:hypothetical protein GF327_03205, partial [Candidatus Woesearchaeota archaeon]|nr:hypothetical protein [Candidatus Woesearchaeota archaeon]
CSSTCQEEFCGDGILQPGLNEGCDDANKQDNDGCSAICEIETEDPVCGNRERETGEECDAGEDNGIACTPLYNEECEYCKEDCSIETIQGGYCGDSNLDEPYEECDFGDSFNNDGCSAMCEWEHAGDSDISCLADISNYLLHKGTIPYAILLSEIYDYDPDEIVFVMITDSSDEINSEILESKILVYEEDGFDTTETVNITVYTNKGFKKCPVNFTNLDSKCDKLICNDCFLPGFGGYVSEYECLFDLDCLDESIYTFNQPVQRTARQIIPGAENRNEFIISEVDSFSSDFVITAKYRYDNIEEEYEIKGTGAHNSRNASVFEIEFLNHENNPARICPELIKISYDIGEEIYEIDSDLKITNSRAVSGYYYTHRTFTKGPFIFTSNVWLREK